MAASANPGSVVTENVDTVLAEVTTSLRAVQGMLRPELEYWFHTDRSATSDTIVKYDTVLDLLLAFLEEKNFAAFFLVFPKYNITHQGIRACFRASDPGCKERRDRAGQLFASACHRIAGTICRRHSRSLSRRQHSSILVTLPRQTHWKKTHSLRPRSSNRRRAARHQR